MYNRLWHNAGNPGQNMRARLLVFLPVLFLCAQNPSIPLVPNDDDVHLATITGRITDAGGAPLGGAIVILLLPGSAAKPDSAVADEGGTYVFNNVVPGRYLVQARKEGYAPGFNGSGGSGSQPTELLKVENGTHLTAIDIRLSPGGQILGTVLDADGSLLPFARVQAFRLMMDGVNRTALPSGGATADDKGRYRLTSLTPDTYFLSATPPPQKAETAHPAGVASGLRNVMSYYPSARDLMSAAPILVTAGTALDGIDIRLRKTEAYSIRGRLDSPNGMRIEIWPVGVPVWAVSPRMVQVKTEDGAFEFGGIEPGQYQLLALGQSETRYARLLIQVEDREIEDLRLTVKRAFPVRGRLMPEREDKISLAGVLVILSPRDRLPTKRLLGRSDEDGNYVINGVIAGKYEVQAVGLPEQTIVSEVHFGGQIITDRDVELTDHDNRAIEIAVSRKGGSLAGVVTDYAGKPVAKCAVLTVLDGQGPQEDRYAEITDANGRFLERSLPPGKYLIFAGVTEPRIIADPARFANYAQRAEIRAGERTTVQLKTMPAGVGTRP